MFILPDVVQPDPIFVVQCHSKSDRIRNIRSARFELRRRITVCHPCQYNWELPEGRTRNSPERFAMQQTTQQGSGYLILDT